MKKYRVIYWYLATGMEGIPDEKDYGIVEATSPKEACNIMAERECGSDTEDVRTFFLGCLHAKEEQ